MRALKFLVGLMGVLIVVGTTALVVIIGKRIAAPAPPPGPAVTATLAEPPGSEIAAISATPDRTLLLLKGGGPDRVVALDPRSGAVLGTVTLKQ
jgi:hypothetical protein